MINTLDIKKLEPDGLNIKIRSVKQTFRKKNYATCILQVEPRNHSVHGYDHGYSFCYRRYSVTGIIKNGRFHLPHESLSFVKNIELKKIQLENLISFSIQFKNLIIKKENIKNEPKNSNIKT